MNALGWLPSAAITTANNEPEQATPVTQPLLFASALTFLLPQTVAATPLEMPAGAIQIGTRVEAPARYAMPIAAFDGTTVPARIVTGALDQNAWRVDGFRGNTLSLLQPLSDQLAAQGYQVMFTCQTIQCGGFDFRYGIDVLPEPQMHIDLGDFYYLAAMNTSGDAVSLLVSRAADQGFLQVTSVNTAATTALLATAPKTEPPPGPETATKPAAAGTTPVAQPDLQATPLPAPQTAAPPAPTAVIDVDVALMTTGSLALDDLVFASGKAVLQDQDYPSLAALAAWLIAHPLMKLTLVGHTDATGSLATNVALSRQRAAAVRDRLIKQYGAAAAQIDAEGAGYLSPRASNQTPEGRAQNRRVEVLLTSTPPN